jgi:antitoxin ParD1/3/4
MNINFSPVDEQYLKSKVESGYYSNITEAVRDAVRKLREQEEQKEKGRQKLMALLQPALDQIERGETVPYTPELMDQIMQKAIDNVRSGKKRAFKDEVIPPSWRE